MFSFKRSLIALVGLLVIVGTLAALMPLVSRGQGDIKNPFNRDPRRSYYLTQTRHTGGQALTACASGYHMASLWEILDPSNLKYNTALGVTLADSGFGPPTGIDIASGWIRTGFDARAEFTAGQGNCLAWTSATDGAGTIVYLPLQWNSAPETIVNPWTAAALACSSTIPVWCMQD